MGLFESKEEKQKRKDQEEKRKEQEAHAKLAHYGLDDLSDPKDRQLAFSIVDPLDDFDLLDFALTVKGSTNHILRTEVDYQQAIFKQNLLMIRQLDRITKLLAERSVEGPAEE